MVTAKSFKRINVLPSKARTVAKATLPPRNPVAYHGTMDMEPVSAPVVPVVKPSAPVAAGHHLPKLSKDFLLAGKALFTVSNSKTDEHYTYKVRMKENEFPVGSGRMTKSFFLSVKHSGGQWPYSYVGILNPQTGTIKCTTKSAFLPGTKEYDVAAWACQVIIASKMIPDNYEIAHAGKCGRCARTLTDPESIERGIGPECWSVMGH